MGALFAKMGRMGRVKFWGCSDGAELPWSWKTT